MEQSAKKDIAIGILPMMLAGVLAFGLPGCATNAGATGFGGISTQSSLVVNNVQRLKCSSNGNGLTASCVFYATIALTNMSISTSSIYFQASSSGNFMFGPCCKVVNGQPLHTWETVTPGIVTATFGQTTGTQVPFYSNEIVCGQPTTLTSVVVVDANSHQVNPPANVNIVLQPGC